MKRFISLLLSILLLIPSFSHANAEIDAKWKKMFDILELDELTKANGALQYTMFSKLALVYGAEVPSGIYIVGVDIPSGVYRIEFPSASDFVMGYIEVISPDPDIWIPPTYIGGTSGVKSIGKIDLKDGMTITINNANAVFYTYTGLFH